MHMGSCSLKTIIAGNLAARNVTCTCTVAALKPSEVKSKDSRSLHSHGSGAMDCHLGDHSSVGSWSNLLEAVQRSQTL